MIRWEKTDFVDVIISSTFFALILTYNTVIVKFYRNFFLLALPAGLSLLLFLCYVLLKKYKTTVQLQNWDHKRLDHQLGIIIGFTIGIFLVHSVIFFLL
ncbi:hypothetical protein MNBD_CHLOROFLEXI01-2267 [hydrothermal vent metagenome]|uniref:Uncharacterized protein n=1 Tax=hydrothermal vent metagenome TaxID=652676 RepID=A0A3B0UUE2_9ZZZZ